MISSRLAEPAIPMTTLSNEVAGRAKALQSLSQLPPFSPVLQKLIATLANDSVAYKDLANIIEKDTVLSGNVLRLVNSALYGRQGTVNSVIHGISILGLTKLRNFALGFSISGMWSRARFPASFSMARFNLHALATAILADQIAVRTPVQSPECAFAAGLFHELGRLLIAIALPAGHERVEQLRKGSSRPVEEWEREVLGIDHLELSAEAVARWNLPDEVKQAIAHSQDPIERATPVKLATVIQLSHEAANLAGASMDANGEADLQGAVACLERLMPSLMAGRIVEDSQREIESMRSFL